MVLASGLENCAYLLSPHLDQVTHDCLHTSVAAFGKPLVDIINDGLFPCLHLLEHLLHDSDVDLEAVVLLLGQLQVRLRVIAAAFRAYFVDSLLELGQNKVAYLVQLLDFLDQIAVVLEVLDIFEQINDFLRHLALQVDSR